MLGDRLRTKLTIGGYTPSRFAHVIGETRQTVDGWLQRGVPPRKCFKVARLLDVNPEWLVVGACTDEELMSPETEAFLDSFRPDEADAMRIIINAFKRPH
jgi:hypothetical protein